MKNLPSKIRAAQLALLWALVSAPIQAASFTETWSTGFVNGGVVPDGSVTGWSDTRVLSGISENSILDLDVNIQLTGGWNGDLYAYLVHSSGFSVLLNRVGVTAGDPFGYGDAGLNLRFDDGASNGDIHRYQTIPGFATSITDGSSWAPDARAVNPLTVTDADPRDAYLNSFNGLDPNGSWTLFIADLSGGDISSMKSWGLSIDANQRSAGVPESASAAFLLALGICGLLLVAKNRARLQSPRPNRDSGL